MPDLAPFVAFMTPPLVGAFIGYLTNDIAIRMLFRPLKPWKILGVRLPLTPGIIPAKRFELAEKMGEMVGSHLLTGEDVGRTLERESFRRELQGVVTDKIGAFLDRELGPAASLVPADFQARFRDLVGMMSRKVAGGVSDYLESPAFEARLREFLNQKGKELLSRDVESFLTPERYGRLRSTLEDRLADLLCSAEMEKAVAGFLDHKIEALLRSGRPVRELLPEDLVESILDQMEKEVPPLIEKFGDLLHDPAFRERLAQRAKAGIDKFLDSLQGFAGLLSGFVNIDKLNARMPEFFDQASEEIAKWLQEEKTRKQVAEIFRGRIDGLLDRSVSSYVEAIPAEKIAQMRGFATDQALKLIRAPKTAEYLLDAVDQGVDRIRTRPMGELLEKALLPGGVERVLETAGDGLLAALRSPAFRETFEQALADIAEERLFRQPLGRLSGRIPADLRQEVEAGILRQVEDLLKREVPPLVEALNVRRMVQEKVNSLDILKVEGLLLSIMEEQFKYINLFGALLGFIIGLANVIFLYLMR